MPRAALQERPVPPLSILDLAHVAEGATPADALHNSLDLAQHAEEWGYKRFWLAEHHNVVGSASAAIAIGIGYVAAGTLTIHVGAGGIMLPNHAPLIIAEQFGTLEALYPGSVARRSRPQISTSKERRLRATLPNVRLCWNP